MNAQPKAAHCVTEIVSGGQTGVDRGALDAALDLGIKHGGWCPRGRRAEDGTVPPKYDLQETESRKYHIRTQRNVTDSDGTLILYRKSLTGGTELTRVYADRYGKPVFLADMTQEIDRQEVLQWIAANNVCVLNIAGPRESGAPGIAAECQRFVANLLSNGKPASTGERDA